MSPIARRYVFTDGASARFLNNKQRLFAQMSGGDVVGQKTIDLNGLKARLSAAERTVVRPA